MRVAVVQTKTVGIIAVAGVAAAAVAVRDEGKEEDHSGKVERTSCSDWVCPQQKAGPWMMAASAWPQMGASLREEA